MDQSGYRELPWLDVSLTKRISRGFAFKTNYTWGKTIDLNSAYFSPSGGNEPANLPSPYYRRELSRGVSSFSIAHQFNAYTSYQRSEERRVGKECRSRWSP